jgi:hypothetical protein
MAIILVTPSVGIFLGTCPLVVLVGKNPGNKLRDKNLTELLMELVTNIWAVLYKKTLPAHRAARTEERHPVSSRLYRPTSGNPSQLHYIKCSFMVQSVQ